MSNGQPGSAALAMAPPKTLSSPRVVDGRKHWTDSSDAGALLSSSQNTGFFINTFSALSAQHSTVRAALGKWTPSHARPSAFLHQALLDKQKSSVSPKWICVCEFTTLKNIYLFNYTCRNKRSFYKRSKANASFSLNTYFPHFDISLDNDILSSTAPFQIFFILISLLYFKHANLHASSRFSLGLRAAQVSEVCHSLLLSFSGFVALFTTLLAFW